MAKTIAIVNQKGGVGKTATSVALATGLIDRGHKVLLVDMDPQTNATYTYDADKEEAVTIFDVLTGSGTAKEAIQHMEMGDIIPADDQLSVADVVLANTGKEYRLKENLASVSDDYDFIVIDTPPTLNVLTLNALTAANYALITAQADVYSLQGIGQLENTIESVKKYTNPDLIVIGILLTRFKTRANLSKTIADTTSEMANLIHTRIFDSRIREAVAVQEAACNKRSLLAYAPKSKVTADYDAFIEEFLERID